MYRNRKRAARPAEERRSAGQWERIWMKRGALASGSVASAFAVLMAAVWFPEVFALLFLTVIALSIVALYIVVICNDVGFDGELKN